MKKILVMGGSYFIGKSITETLSNAGYNVTVLNRGSRKPGENVRQIVCDRNDEKAMQQVLADTNFDIVIDVCGLNRRELSKLCNSMDCSRLSHFVFISSSAVYAVEELTPPFAESDRLGPNSFWKEYGTNKIEAEQFLTQHFSGSKTTVFLLRPPYVYGENNYAQRESFVFEHLLSDRPLLLPLSNPKLQFIYAPDLAHIVQVLLEYRLQGIHTFNVGNQFAPTASEWIESCCKACGKQAQIIPYDYQKDGRHVRDFFPFYDYSNVLEVSKIKALVPEETDFIMGLHNAYEWFVSHRTEIRFHETIMKNELDILKSLC